MSNHSVRTASPSSDTVKVYDTVAVPDPPVDVRRALLMLAVAPMVQGVRYSTQVADASAKFVSQLVDASPLRGPARRLEALWRTQITEAEAAASRSLEQSLQWLMGHVDLVSIVLEKIDINELVAERVDIDAVINRVDVNTVINRVDVVALAREVIAELDVPELVRDSSQSMAAETVDGLRRHGMSADRSVAEFIDRILRRRRGGDSPPEPPTTLEPT